MDKNASKSIEHIQPQSSNYKWIHSIGNLILLPPGINSSLKDKPPIEKSAKYIEVGIKGTIKVGEKIQSDGWSKKHALERADSIKKFIFEEWGD